MMSRNSAVSVRLSWGGTASSPPPTSFPLSEGVEGIGDALAAGTETGAPDLSRFSVDDLAYLQSRIPESNSSLLESMKDFWWKRRNAGVRSVLDAQAPGYVDTPESNAAVERVAEEWQVANGGRAPTTSAPFVARILQDWKENPHAFGRDQEAAILVKMVELRLDELTLKDLRDLEVAFSEHPFTRKEFGTMARVKESVLAVQNGMPLYRLDPSMRDTREVVIFAVEQVPMHLRYASDRLRNDRLVVLAAVGREGWALQHASANLRNNPEVVLAAIKQDGTALRFASENLQNDPEVVRVAVKQDGLALRYASEDVRSNPGVVLAAVKQNGEALYAANGNLHNDTEVVLAAVKQNGSALRFASGSLQNNREVVLAAVQQNGLTLEYAGENVRNDLEVVLAAVRQNREAIRWVSERFWIYPEVELAAVQYHERRALQAEN